MQIEMKEEFFPYCFLLRSDFCLQGFRVFQSETLFIYDKIIEFMFDSFLTLINFELLQNYLGFFFFIIAKALHSLGASRVRILHKLINAVNCV